MKVDTAQLPIFKMLLNSTISTPGARFITADVKNFYLGTDLPCKEYLKIPISDIPQEIINEYKLMDKVHNGFICIKVIKGMYGLPQAGILANNQLRKTLAKYGYAPVKHTAGLWKHATRPVTFVLIVDDFGVKFIGKENANHLLKALKQL